MKATLRPIFLSPFSRTVQPYHSFSDPKFVNDAKSGKDNFEKDFQKSHVKTTLLQKILLGVGSGVISITSPSRGDMIAVMGEVTGHQAWMYIQKKMMESSEGKQILEEKPRISSTAVDLEKLKKYPEGTLGKAYSNFLVKYGYSPDTRNSVQFVDDIELAYVAQRYREAHDLFHTLLDMPTNMLGEVTVKWVEAIQLKLPMCAAGALFGSVRLAPKFSRTYSTRALIKLNESLVQQIETNELKPKKHPGIRKIPCIQLPSEILTGIKSVLKNEKKKILVENAERFSRQLFRRALPVESAEIEKKRKVLYEALQKKYSDNLSEKELIKRVERKLNYLYYNWKPTDFSKKKNLEYVLCRAAPEYAALKKVLLEIVKRDNLYEPKTLLDFGSGIGTVSWVANDYWKGSLEECFCVDASEKMSELAAQIIKHNDISKKPIIENIYFRQYLPPSTRSYDIVVSSFSFLELPNCESRLKTLTNLWNNTRDYLVLIENGTNAGFSVIDEARNFILKLSRKYGVQCYIFAPCPHDKECPILKAEKTIPCNFEVNFQHLDQYRKGSTETFLFSYVIIKKGEKPAPEERQCRIITFKKKSKRVHCKLCMPHGELRDFCFTAAKHGKIPYRCMRSSNAGDLIPGVVELIETPKRELVSDEDVVENDTEVNK